MNRVQLTVPLLICSFFCASFASGASHNDAPLIHEDPAANITDVYAFITEPGGQKKLVVVMQTNPLEVPGDGINYYRFSDQVEYRIHLTKGAADGTVSPTPAITYNFRFESRLLNSATAFLYGVGNEIGPIQQAGDARQNLQQVFFADKVVAGQKPIRLIPDSGCLVPPVNVGPRTTPKYYEADGTTLIQGATTFAQQDDYTRASIFETADGSRVFAGQRDDAFYADIAGIFDFLGLRNPGKDTFKGFNVQVIAIEIPIGNIVGPGEVPIVGVFATTARERTVIGSRTAVNAQGMPARTRPSVGNSFVQVGRMGNPLFNEVLVAQMDKDLYNVTMPNIDVAQFKIYAENPEIAGLINLVFGTNIQTTGRQDLVDIFIPDVLKVDTSTAAVPLSGQPGFDRLSLFGAPANATVFSPFQGKQIPAGWPNGRRLGDDVIDIAFTAIASGPNFETITPLGDNVNSNDLIYDLVFPYSATPHGGTTASMD